MGKKIRITFAGGAGATTGSNFLVEDLTTNNKILIDCGLRQGCHVCEEDNRETFSYDPKAVSTIFITHAHIDHIGRVPKLVKEGFNGEIISTAPTKDISELMLQDSLGVLEKEARRQNKELIYTKDDVRRAMERWHTTPYHHEKAVGNFKVKLKNAGHILGSAFVEIEFNNKKIVFTGDLGNTPAPLLPDTEALSDAEILIIESVYGDRNHEDRKNRKHILEDIIEGSIKKGGALLIPAFSLERTQDLLFEINSLVESGKIPQVPIFIDSPLAIDITKIYKKYNNFFNANTKNIIKSGDDIFKFPGLKFTYTREESLKIWDEPNPKVIIAGSGMSNGGRIIHHEKKYLGDPNSTLLIVGYQVPGSMGRQLQDGAKEVDINGAKIKVNASVKTILGYSAHKDAEGLFEFVSGSANSLKNVYVVLGEPKSSAFFAQRIQDYLGIKATVPKIGDRVDLEL